MIRARHWVPIAVVLLGGSACYGTAAGLGAAWAPVGALALANARDSAPTASASAAPAVSASASVAPSAAPSVASSASAPSGPPAACRGARLMLSGVAELCEVADGTKVLPEVVRVEIAGPAETKPGEVANYEIRLVNRAQEALLVAFGATCTWELRATDSERRNVIRRETTSGFGQSVTSCSAETRYFEVLLEPGGMVVEPIQWRARGELHVDGQLKKRESLASGKYTLHTSTWLYRGEPGEDRRKSHGAFRSADGELPIVVR